MSNPNLDSRYAKPVDVAAAISAQAATDAGQYAIKGGQTINAVDYGLSVNSSATTNGTSLLNAVNAAGGKPVYIPAGDYPMQVSFTDQDIRLYGEGRFVHQQASTAITVTRSFGSSISVSNFTSLQLGPINGSGTIVSETVTAITPSGTWMSSVAQGDVFLLNSNDVYSYADQIAIAAGYSAGQTKVWMAGYVAVHGIGLTVSITGSIPENAIVIGGTSGATGLVLSVSNNGTNSIVIFGKVSGGDFVNGETLVVGGSSQGTIAAAPYIIAANDLIDTYTTTPQLRKIPKSVFVINGPSVVASGDVDSIVGASNRLPAIVLTAVYKPMIRSRIFSAWTRAIQLVGCYGGEIDVIIDKLPDNANTSESAYGYGVEVTGTTEGVNIKVNATNVRHGFTTNVNWTSNPVYLNWAASGVPKFNRVHDSYVKDALSASFDTHWACYYMTFENCRSVRSTSGLRNITASGGFQNRGFGTKYVNCYDYGSVDSFIENSTSMDAGWAHEIRYQGCISDNYQRYGFNAASTSASNNAKIVYTDCQTRGDGRAVNLPYFQAGFQVSAIALATYERCTARRFNGSSWRINAAGSSGGRYNIIDCYADYMECNVATGTLRVDGTAAELNISNFRIRANPYNTNTPGTVFRNGGGNSAWTIDSYSVFNANSSQVSVPFMLISSGTPSVIWAGVSNGITPNIITKTATYSVLPQDGTILASGTFTITLPVPPNVPKGRSFIIKNTGSGTITVIPGSGTLDAGTSLAAGTRGTYQTDGTNWYQIG